jgi:hypothetical protein
MATRHEYRELQGVEIRGVPVVLAFARDRRAVLFIGGFDADGLLETMDDVKAVAQGFLSRLDALPSKRKTEETNPTTATTSPPPPCDHVAPAD